MTQQPYIELYRPKKFNEVIGEKNSKIASIIESKLKEKSLPRALLFTGKTGCGKTTTARIIANMTTEMPEMDIQEINMSDKTGVDSIRELGDKYHLSAMAGTKTYILDEIHRVSAQGQDALLKYIEGVPPSSRFILCTDSPEKLDKAIIGRCSEYKFERPEDDSLFKKLKEIVIEKNIQIQDDTLKLIIKKSPNVRKALNNLESLVGIGEITPTLVSTLIESEIDEDSSSFILTGILIWPTMFIKDKSEDKINLMDIWDMVVSPLEKSIEKRGAQEIALGIAGYARNNLLAQKYKFKKDGSEKNKSYQIREFKRLVIILNIFGKDLFMAKPENSFCAYYLKAISEILKVK